MFRKSLLALAAIASLGALVLATTDASARGFGGGGFHGGGARVGAIHGGGMRLGGGIRPVFRGGGLHRFHGGFHFRRFVHRPHWHHHHWCGRFGWHWRWCGWARPWIAPAVVTGGVATTYAAAPTYNRCTCLTKEYTPEGAVVFKDVCTQEMAMNPPAGPGPTQQSGFQPEVQPQPMPQQSYAAPPSQAYPQYR